ncbi:MAG TPA: bifunctional methylenetetrahydrofolate dehydrogenase/methenyltetrahydrofolate cyclohydrolase FolD [Treponemataceae bacterium]|nr:bifunctional methylenetetrahydrofolate dehydrogenase/methenyltetrahydrofolate cyclohydrolase FolD [Treponemataceae bacterium]
MSAVIIDGYTVAATVRAQVAKSVSALVGQGITPCLSVVLVGEDPASVSYVSGKEKALREVGMKDASYRLPATTTEEELITLIHRLNADTTVHGILVQLPLPRHINEARVIMAINPEKDVDGFHPVNIGNMVIERPCFLPCTPHGVMYLLKNAGIETRGAHAVVVGRSNIVGKPLSILLARKDSNATVSVCHTGTRDLASITRQADILIAAAGKPRMISADMIKPGAAVIDVGVNRVEDASSPKGYRLVGDVDFDAALEVASFITPVPRGVGPMTIAMLMENTLLSAERVARSS